MGVKSYDHQSITGLSNSGTTDSSGAWNVGVDINSILSGMPTNATGVLVKTINTTGSAQWAGIRVSGAASAEFQVDLSGNVSRTDFIPLFGNTLIEFYRESASIEFRVLWVLDSTWTMFPLNSRPTISSSGGSFANRTVSECPENSTIITTGFRWRPTGESTNVTNNLSGQQLVKLDAAKTFSSAAAATQTVIGYTTGSVNWTVWLADTISYTADSTWRAAANEYAGNVAAFIVADKSGTAIDVDFRSRGSAFSLGASSAPDENFFTDLNSLGQFDYLAETGLASPLYVLATIPDVESSSVNINSIDQTVTSKTSTADFNAPFPATSFSITGDSVTKTASATTVDADTASFVMPQWEDGETAVALGAITISATDGTDTTSDFDATLTMEAQHPDAGSPSAFTSIILGTLDPSAAVAIPELNAGDQVAYDPLRMTVRADGIVELLLDEIADSQSILFVRNAITKFVTEVTLDTSGGSVVPPGGLTVRGLSVTGLSVSGLSVRGL